MLRTPQRIYNEKALEKWFERLTDDWEQWFRDDELSMGRRLYRRNEILSTEITEDSATIAFKEGKEDVYAVIDWKGDLPDMRVSTQRIQPARGLAVAGFYELEELILDHLPTVPRERGKSEPLKINAEPPPSPEPPRPQIPSRPLEVAFFANPQGLLLRAFWLDEKDPSQRQAAFPGNVKNEHEREQLIRITAMLHRTGFQSRPKAHGYMLSDASGVITFLQNDLHHWKRHFKVVMDPALKPWMTGARRIGLQVQVDGDPSDIRIGWKVQSSGKAPGDAALEQILRHPTGTHLIPGEGIFRIESEQAETVREWKTLLDAYRDRPLPPYLIFRFIDHPDFKVHLGESIRAWRNRLQEQAEAKLRLPAWMRPYQRDGVQWLNRVLESEIHPLLADEMGLGKTVQTLALIESRKALKSGPVLVVCPASVVPVWGEEISRFFSALPYSVVKKDDHFQPDSAPRIWLCSYTQLRRHKSELEGVNFSIAVLDEAQFIKNPDGKTSQACSSIRARHRVALTGTPMENRPLDLWTIFRFLMPGLLEGRSSLEEASRDNSPELLKRLRRQIKPFMLRRTKAKVATELPPRTDVVLHCALTPRQETLYRQWSEEGMRKMEDEQGRSSGMHVFALMTRLRQVCCDPSLLPGMTGSYEHSTKLRMLQEKLEDALASGAKVVVFSQFVTFLNRIDTMLRHCFPDTPLFQLTGKTRDRAVPVEGFRKQSGSAVFLVSLKAGGTGLNLQMADYVFLMDPWWNPAVEAQAVDRVHRLGQKKRVFIYRLVTRGTLEERIEMLKDQKTEVFQQLMQGMARGISQSDYLNQIDDWLRYQSPVDGGL